MLCWVSDFILFQCNRPPPCHSRDLHSSIIAAFNTCHVLLINFPFLLDDKDCITSVLEITELAISGSKSKIKSSDPPSYKDDKSLSPVSLRVSCVAEHLLSSVLQHVGYHLPASLAEQCSTSLDEKDVLEMLKKESFLDPWFKPTDYFHYFSCDNNLIIAVSKESNDENLSSAVIIRSSSGKTVWHFKQRQTSNTVTDKVSNPANIKIKVTQVRETNNNFPKSGPKICNHLPTFEFMGKGKPLNVLDPLGNDLFI